MFKSTSIYIALLLLVQLIFAQSSFKITLLDGTAKAQRSQKKSWESVYFGDEINDNDIVETYFQTRIVLNYGVDNSIILGSNTRSLFNIKAVPHGDLKIINVNITLFSGGVLVKSITNSRVSIYTSNAVAQIDSGTISTVVEARTGHTGFQVLGGAADARNVAQQQGKNLSPGLTTIVLPGKEPTAPLYITYRHVAVLKHFFGDEFIDQQIEEAGIQPTEDKTSVSRLSLSQGMQSKAKKEEQMQKRLFSQDKIWGIILDDRAKKRKTLEPIHKPSSPFNSKGELKFNAPIAISGGSVYPKFCLIPSLHFPNFSIGLNLPFAKNATGNMSMNIGSFAGVLDKIHHITVGNINKSRYFFKLGPIEHYTLGEGLVVNNYQNKNIYTVTQPLGIKMRYRNELFDVNAFISDVTDWYVGGAHCAFTIGNSWLGCGYYYDANQYKGTLTSETSRFIDIDNVENITEKIPTDSIKSNSHIYEINLKVWQQVRESFSFDVLFQFAQKIAKGGIDGYVIKGPEIGITMNNFNYGLSYIVDKGRLLEGHLSSMYMSNRLRYEAVSADTVIYWTQNNMLSEDRKSYGFVVFFRVKPIKGTEIGLSFRQDFLTRTPLTDDTAGTVVTDPTIKKNNFSYALSLKMNEGLFTPIKFAEIYFNQVHGGFYPTGGKYLASWGFSTGFDIMTAPLFFNIAFEAGLNFTYIDLYDVNLKFGFPNNNIESGDNVIEFYAGLRWGFL